VLCASSSTLMKKELSEERWNKLKHLSNSLN
jgi:hypothetical protein